MEELISVIVPTYNRAHTIVHSIRSVMSQSYKNLEIIVVDDCSIDNTEQIIKNLNDQRIIYLKNQKNMGASSARNVGLEHSKGSLIAFQDSDDEWLPNKLEIQSKALKESHSSVGVSYSSFLRIEGDKKFYIPSNRVRTKDGNIFECLLNENFIITPVLLVKSECFTKIGAFDNRISGMEDWDLCIRLSKHYKFCFTDKTLVIHNNREDSLSFAKINQVESMKIIVQKYENEYECTHKKLIAKQCSVLGSLLYQIGQSKEGRKYLIKAIKMHPLAISSWLKLLLTVLNAKTYSKIANLRDNLLHKR